MERYRYITEFSKDEGGEKSALILVNKSIIRDQEKFDSLMDELNTENREGSNIIVVYWEEFEWIEYTNGMVLCVHLLSWA